MWRLAANIAQPIAIHVEVSVDALREPVVALVGPNGAGKSTLLKAWAGFLGHEQGGALIGPPWRRPLAWVAQEPTLIGHRTVQEQVEWVLRGSLTDVPEVADWLDVLGLKTHLNQRPGQLSGGLQQRAALLRALAARPKILALDESLNQIDAPSRESILGRLREWAQADDERLLILTTHQFQDVAHLADRVLVMDQGQILRDGDPSVVARDPRTWTVAALVGYTSLLRLDNEICAIRPDGVGIDPPGQSISGQIVRCGDQGMVVRLPVAAGRFHYAVAGIKTPLRPGEAVALYVHGVPVEDKEQ